MSVCDVADVGFRRAGEFAALMGHLLSSHGLHNYGTFRLYSSLQEFGDLWRHFVFLKGTAMHAL